MDSYYSDSKHLRADSPQIVKHLSHDEHRLFHDFKKQLEYY